MILLNETMVIEPAEPEGSGAPPQSEAAEDAVTALLIPNEIEIKETMRCLCQHGTDGPNCETCLPDHWDRTWKRATQDNANECLRKS